MLETYMIKQLAAFADENTLSGVAERLHVSQPAVSRAMKKLERSARESLEGDHD